MRKKILSACIGLMAVCMVTVPEDKTYAAEIADKGGDNNTSIEKFVDVSSDITEGRLPEEKEVYGILTTKYRVSVSKATMRSGPGTSYSSLGTLYKNDVVWVRSISNGWAKFKVNSKWRYISTNCIKKATY